MTEDLFPPFPVPEDLAMRAKESGWPDGLLQRALDLRYPRDLIEQWLSYPREQVVEPLDEHFQSEERLRFGTLRARPLLSGDVEAYAALWDNAPEEIGPFDVIVERRPNPVAQFRLQDAPETVIIEDRGVVVSAITWAHRNVVVGGEQLYILCSQGLRVHQAFRRQGLSTLVRRAGRSPFFNRVNAEMIYFRDLNNGVVRMMERTSPEWRAAQDRADADIPGMPVTVHQFVPPSDPPADDVPTAIRDATPHDLPACYRLIERTHGHLDLFEPTSPWTLGHRLDQFRRGRDMPGWTHVYGWPHFRVVEDDGEIVACGGLWDRGRDVRERWIHRDTGATQVVSATNVLDFGWADGREDAFERLLRVFLADTARHERTYLTVPLQHHPEVLDRLDDVECVPETRGLQWRMYSAEGPEMTDPKPRVERPYTDLRYW